MHKKNINFEISSIKHQNTKHQFLKFTKKTPKKKKTKKTPKIKTPIFGIDLKNKFEKLIEKCFLPAQKRTKPLFSLKMTKE